ncbi:MAG: SDR family NAD(P)-dependent oxidoreductase, partial [Myxococcales bacterium]|nr:SDR family NAD(P)-dependent oxidoreductase [Myxococcales bacterium]
RGPDQAGRARPVADDGHRLVRGGAALSRMSGIAGKTAVVTGITSGIGRALVHRLIAAEVDVIGIVRKAADAMTLASPGLRTFATDLGDPAARAACLDQLAASAPAIDIIVLNAAEVAYEPPSKMAPDRARHLFEVNFIAAVDLVHALRPKLRRGGHIVALSSVTSRFMPNARFAPYAATKSAMETYCAGLRDELDPDGIKVTLMVPGLVDTPIYDKLDAFQRTRDKIREQIPTWLSAEDVAEAIIWALARPAHVVVGEMVLFPQGQTR